MSNELIQIAARGYHLCLRGIHGPIHWARVIDNGKRLAEYYNVNPRIPELFGAFHDCRRTTEDYETNHGRCGADALILHAPRNRLTPCELECAITACRIHTQTLFNFKLPIEVQICLDADRLDLLRIGVVPDPQYLFTAFAKLGATRRWANERAKQHTPPDWLKLYWSTKDYAI